MHTDKLTTQCHICLQTCKQGGFMCGIWDWQSRRMKSMKITIDVQNALTAVASLMDFIYWNVESLIFPPSLCCWFANIFHKLPQIQEKSLFSPFSIFTERSLFAFIQTMEKSTTGNAHCTTCFWLPICFTEYAIIFNTFINIHNILYIIYIIYYI